MRTAKKSMRVSDLAWEMDDERTVEPRVRVQAGPSALFTTRLTKRMAKVDSALIAIARGELEPDGTKVPAAQPLSPAQPAKSSTRMQVARVVRHDELIEVQDELIEVQDEHIEVEDDWLMSDIEPAPFSLK